MLAYLRTPAVAAKLRADPRIVLAGHSMGGWATAHVAAADPRLIGAVLISAADMGLHGSSPRAAIIKDAGENMETLATTPAALADELIAHRIGYGFGRLPVGLARHPLLVLTSDDGLQKHTDPLVAGVRAAGGQVAERHEPTDHAWSDRRIALETAVVDWLATLR